MVSHPKNFQSKLQDNLNLLREREAKYGGETPLALVNQIRDHQAAITLTEQAIAGEISQVEWHEALKPLLMSLETPVIFQTEVVRIPLQRPPRAEHFTGREGELEQLLTDLQPGRVVTICGPGGIGKSALAAEVVWTLAHDNDPPNRFPDGIVFHSFYNQPQASLALESIARAFGEDPKPTPRDAAQRALAGRQALLLLDGTEDADNLGRVLEVAGSCGVLVTSRLRKDAVAERQDLRPLTPSEAVALLRKWGGDQAADTIATEQICEIVGNLPLAVRLVGRYLTETEETAAEFLDWLAKTPLQALDHGQRQLESVPLLLERSLTQVTKAARQALEVVGLLALAPFERVVIVETLEMSFGQAGRLLGELVNYGLLRRIEQRYEVSHALVHTFARRRVAPSNEIVDSLAVYYTKLAEEQSSLGPEGYTQLDTERVHMMEVLARCVDRELWESVRPLAWAVSANNGYLDIQGYWTERISASQAALSAARALGIRVEEERSLGNLGKVYRLLGQVEKAIEFLEQASIISRETGNPKAISANFGSLGLAYRTLGKLEQAIEYHEKALGISYATGDQDGVAISLSNLGTIYRDLGQVKKAINLHKQALVINRDIDNRYGEAINLSNLGNAYRDQGKIEQAIEFFEQALVINRDIGNRHGEAINLSNLGNAYRDQGKIEQAIEFFEQALAINRVTGNRHGESIDLGNLGNAYRDLKQTERAIGLFEQAFVIAQKIGNRRGEGINLDNLGLAYHDLQQIDQAIEYHKQALTIAREIGLRREEGNSLCNLGNAYRNIGMVNEARAYLEQALTIFEETPSPYAEQIKQWLAELDQAEAQDKPVDSV